MQQLDVNELSERVADRLGGRIDQWRDRAAAALSAEEHREFGRVRRSLDRLGERIDALSDATDERFEGLADRFADHLADVQAAVDDRNRTSWWTRLFWLGLGAGIGAAAAALLDPQTGTRRRHELRDQLESAGRDLADQALQQADHTAGVAKGRTIETAKRAMPETGPVDPKTLREKIRSEVIGQVDGTDAVVVAVHDSGRITLKGSVDSAETERTLVERTRNVAGVRDVDSELTVGAPTA